MAAIERIRVKHRKALVALNAKHMIWRERLRAAARRLARAAFQKESGLKVRKQVGKDKLKMAKKGPLPDHRPRGRPARWPGLCHACMRRHVEEPGGPPHLRSLCARTQAHIKNLKG